MAILRDDYFATKNCKIGETIVLSDGKEWTQKSNGLAPVGKVEKGRCITDSTGYDGDDNTFNSYFEVIEGE